MNSRTSNSVKSTAKAANRSAANTARKKTNTAPARTAAPVKRKVSYQETRREPAVRLYEPPAPRKTLREHFLELIEEIKDNRINGIYYDYNLLAVVIILMCFGLIMLYSTSAYESYKVFKADDMHYFVHQAQIGLAAIIWAWFLSFLPYRLCISLSWPAYILSGILMGMVKYTPLGVEVYGAKRWLDVGVQFQPSEIAKIAIIMLIPMLILKYDGKIRQFKYVLIILAYGAAQAAAAWKWTDNLSTGIIIMMIGIGLVFLADPNEKKYKVTLASGLIIGIPVLWFLSNNLQLLETSDGGFRMRRIYEWLSGGSYQVLQGLYAIGSGGFFGKGLGNSTQKLGTIPEAQNDMIFSILCEELGLFGVLIMIILFSYLLYRLYFIAQHAPTLYASLMVSGVMIHISLQVLLNLCVVLKLLPTTGITLPFISYGGTSLLFLMTEIGIALSVSRSIRDEKPEEAAQAA